MSKISKIQISTGIFWLEVPEAELYVLCGCPADSVKHLMKAGKINIFDREVGSLEPGSTSFHHPHGPV
ncbi:MAG: hypothetical protein VYD83_07875, partial [SAR324 cluster bacterium]|nr:hypothetical protein [SAR324 cluster bacterium]